MANEEIIRNVIQWETDERTVANSVKAGQSLAKSLDTVADKDKFLAKASLDLEKALRAVNDAGEDVKKSAKAHEALEKAIYATKFAAEKSADAQVAAAKKATDAIKKQQQETERAAKSAAKVAQDSLREQQRVVQSQQRVQQQTISQRKEHIGGAGDIASSVGQISGLASSVGLDTSGFGVAQGIADTVEALPRLKEAVTSIPQTLGAAATALGPVGLVAAGALAALGVAIAIFSESTREAAEKVKLQGEAARAVADQIAGGLTEQDAAKQVEQLEAQVRERERLLAEDQAAYDEWVKNHEGLAGALGQAFDQEEDALAANVDANKQKLKELQANIGEYNEAIDRGLPQTVEAAEKENALAAARDQTASTSTDAAKQEASRQKAIQEAEQKAKTIAQAQQAYSDAAGSAQRKYNDALKAASNTLKDAGKDIQTNLKRSMADLAKSTASDLTKMVTDLNRADQQARIEQHRDALAAGRKQADDLAKIQRDANRSQKDLLRNRDFLALDLLAENTQTQIEDQQTAADIEARERDIAAADAATDRRRAAYQERTDRLEQHRQAMTDAREAARRQLEDARTANERQRRDAALAKQSELANAQAALKSKLALEAEYWKQSIGLVQNAIGAIRGASGGNVNVNVNQNFNGANVSSQQMELAAMNAYRKLNA